MTQRFIAIDQSTSSTKALLFDEQCKVLARTNVDHKQYYPQTGWVEHDAEEIYTNMVEAIRKLMENVDLHYSLIPHIFPSPHQPARDSSGMEQADGQAHCQCRGMARHPWC